MAAFAGTAFFVFAEAAFLAAFFVTLAGAVFLAFFALAQRWRCASAIRARASSLMTRFLGFLPTRLRPAVAWTEATPLPLSFKTPFACSSFAISSSRY